MYTDVVMYRNRQIRFGQNIHHFQGKRIYIYMCVYVYIIYDIQQYFGLYNVPNTVNCHLYATQDRHGHFVGRCKMIACVITAELETVYGFGEGLKLISDRRLHYYPPRTR